MKFISQQYQRLCKLPSDINEHLPIMMAMSAECKTIAELGVRDIVSTWAFLQGLLNNNSDTKRLICVDVCDIPNIDIVKYIGKKENICVKFIKHDSATVKLPKVDMVFIDTWHVYGHLKRELEHLHSNVGKYIVMHDTEIDKIYGEVVRLNHDPEKASAKSGYPLNEITTGLGIAIIEFLTDHPEWEFKVHFTNCCGLTILQRK
jgi:cephalosporin hydroxylase